MRRMVILLALCVVLGVAGCGVSAQDQPTPLTTSPLTREPIPTTTQQPDPGSTTTSPPTSRPTRSPVLPGPPPTSLSTAAAAHRPSR